MNWQDVDLPQLASVAGATVGLVIATAILLSWLTARYTPNFDKYRALCREFRDGPEGERRNGVRDQIVLFQRRLHLINWGSSVLCVALLCSLVGIVCSTLSTMFHGKPAVIVIGLSGLFLAFVLFAIAIILVLLENRFDLRTIAHETQDLDLDKQKAKANSRVPFGAIH
jgi:Protein of unknown function (DUF2721)